MSQALLIKDRLEWAEGFGAPYGLRIRTLDIVDSMMNLYC